MSPPSIWTLGLVVTLEGKSSYPLKICLLLLKVTVIFMVGVKESITSPITLPTSRGSGDTLDILYFIDNIIRRRRWWTMEQAKRKRAETNLGNTRSGKWEYELDTYL